MRCAQCRGVFSFTNYSLTERKNNWSFADWLSIHRAVCAMFPNRHEAHAEQMCIKWKLIPSAEEEAEGLIKQINSLKNTKEIKLDHTNLFGIAREKEKRKKNVWKFHRKENQIKLVWRCQISKNVEFREKTVTFRADNQKRQFVPKKQKEKKTKRRNLKILNAHNKLNSKKQPSEEKKEVKFPWQLCSEEPLVRMLVTQVKKMPHSLAVTIHSIHFIALQISRTDLREIAMNLSSFAIHSRAK